MYRKCLEPRLPFIFLISVSFEYLWLKGPIFPKNFASEKSKDSLWKGWVNKLSISWHQWFVLVSFLKYCFLVLPWPSCLILSSIVGESYAKLTFV